MLWWVYASSSSMALHFAGGVGVVGAGGGGEAGFEAGAGFFGAA